MFHLRKISDSEMTKKPITYITLRSAIRKVKIYKGNVIELLANFAFFSAYLNFRQRNIW